MTVASVDRYLGALLGLTVGDAVRTSVDFKPARPYRADKWTRCARNSVGTGSPSS